MKKTFWKDYWDKQSNGQHRSQEEAFLKSESEEKLLHLAKGENLLDFGCGSADLLAYYAQFFTLSVGADNSKLMLEKAKSRLSAFNILHNVRLINSDTYQIWNDIAKELGNGFKFNCITTGQVIQYLSKKEIEDFIYNAVHHLTDNGKICLFDIVDARTFELWRAGLFNSNSFNYKVVIKLIIGKVKGFINKFRGKPFHELGYVYPPSFFINLAQKYNLKTAYFNSVYYEYRYHIIIYKK